MEILHNNFQDLDDPYLGLPESTQDAINQQQVEDEKANRKQRVSGFFDKLFGFAGQASDVYTVYKQGQEPEPMPYDYDITVGDRPRPEKFLGMPKMLAWLLLGGAAIGISYWAYTRSK